jgi:hypothetical protein
MFAFVHLSAELAAASVSGEYMGGGAARLSRFAGSITHQLATSAVQCSAAMCAALYSTRLLNSD